MSAPRLFLIDGNNQMYRAYHAIRGLSGPDGRSTNAVYGFVTMLKKLLTDHRPEYIVASFDLAGPTFRDQLVADYKANRTPMPPDLAEQIAWVHDACRALGVPIVNLEGCEADDVIGTLARKAAAAGFEAVIVTGDKDFFQLVGGPITVFNPRDEGAWFDADGVLQKFGVRPDQVVDVLALMGDTIDNVKGVPGIGEKGARDLIASHGTLDALLEKAADVPQKRYREGLQTYADQARHSRELLKIRTDVDVPFEPDRFKYAGVNRERCYELFSTLGFRSLVMEYAPTATTITKHYDVVADGEALTRLVRAAEAAGEIGFHVLTDGAGPMRATIVGFAIATAPRTAWFVPVGRSGGSLLDPVVDGVSLDESLAALRPLLERLQSGVEFPDAVRETTGLNLGQFDQDWAGTIRRRYGLVSWMAAGGLWAVIATLVIALGSVRRRADRPRRAALDEGWILPPDEEAQPDLDRGETP